MSEQTLAEVVAGLDELDDELTIYAAKPWNPDSPVVLGTDDERGEPQAPTGYEYFLEVDLAREVVEAWSVQRDGATPDLAQKCAAVIHYAEHDAYLLPETDQ